MKSKRTTMGAIVFASGLLFFSPQATASLVDIVGQQYSYDSTTGLSWLDPSVTLGLSAPAVITGSLYTQGWRYATGPELNALFRSNLPSLTTALAADVNGNPFYGGATSDFYAPPQLDSTHETATLISALGGPTFIWGGGADAASGMITQFDRRAGANDQAVAILAVWPNGNAEVALAGGNTDNDPSSRVGSFLVRSSLPPVPLPPAAWLFISGIISLVTIASTRTYLKRRAGMDET